MLPQAQAATVHTDTHLVGGVPLYNDGGREKGRFVVGGCKDVWAAVVFVLLAAGVTTSLAVAFVHHPGDYPFPQAPSRAPAYLRTPAPTAAAAGPINVGSVFSALVACLAVVTAMVVSVLALLTAFPKYAIIVSNVAFGGFAVVAGTSSLIQGQYEGVILLVCGLGMWMWMYLSRDRIPFSASLLRQSTSLLKQYPSIYLATIGVVAVSFGHLFLSILASAWFLAGHEAEQTSGGQIAGALFVLSIFLWVAQVASGVLHTTSAGVGATWYFCAGAMPSNPTLKSFKRATTTSFGSVCFGSLLVTVVRMIRIIANHLARNGNHFVRCMVNCFLGCIEALVQLFNDYAFAHVAIYGCAYIDAARATWELTQNCGATVLFTNALVDNTLFMMTLTSSLVVGGLWGAIYQSRPVAVAAFLICAVVMFVGLRPIRSYVIALLVCYAEAPLALQQTAPDIYDKLSAVEDPAVAAAAAEGTVV